MTTPEIPAEAGEVLSSAVQQVVQQSRTLGYHITRHDDWMADAQQRIDRAVADARRALEQSCQSALAAWPVPMDPVMTPLRSATR